VDGANTGPAPLTGVPAGGFRDHGANSGNLT